MEKVKGISLKQLESVIQKYPNLSKIYDLIKSFKEILFDKKPDKLYDWIEESKKMNISGVNKIKVIKRIMYGRCNFETLRKKILILEKIRKFN